MSNCLLIKNCMLTTFFNDGYNATKILENVDILIEDGVIRSIGQGLRADCPTVDGTGKLAAPGFLNGRSCSLAALVSKSLAADIKCSRFGGTPLYTRVNPLLNAAQAALSDGELEDLLRLALYQAIDSGTTTLLEHCSVRELPIFLSLCQSAGMRAIVSPMLMNRQTLPETDLWGRCDNALEAVDEDGLVAWNRGFVERTAGQLAQAGMGLGSVETVSESLIRKTAQTAFDLNCMLMVPLNETQQERDICQERYGLSPAALLHKNHALHKKTITGGNQLTDRVDRAILRSGSSAVALCPVESLHDARLSPFLDCQYDDLEILIGSGRTTPDMTMQTRALTLAGKLERGLRHQMRAQKTFYAVSSGAAKAASLPVGELDEGDIADLILIDLSHPHYHPLTMPITDLIYNTSPSDITEVIVNGKLLKQSGRVLSLDAGVIVQRAEQAAEKIWTRARAIGAF